MTAPDDWNDPGDTGDPDWDDHDPAEWSPPGGPEVTADEHRGLRGWRPVDTIRPGGDLL